MEISLRPIQGRNASEKKSRKRTRKEWVPDGCRRNLRSDALSESEMPNLSLPHLHHRLDHSRLRPRVGGEDFDQVVERGAVGDPGLGVDLALFDELDDAGEVGGEGVAGAEEGSFRPVEDGMAEFDLLRGDADVHQPPAGGDVAEGG